MSPLPVFSIIVLNWNGKRFLAACLGSLREQGFRNFEVVFVDNGSNDGSVQFVSEHFPEVRIVPLPQNVGFCGGNNEGIRQSRGEWIVLLNNDTELVPGFLDALNRAISLFPDAGMFACKMLFAHDRSTIDNCGFTVSSAGTAQEIGRNEIDRGQYGPELEPFGPSGGAGVYSRRMLETISLLDDDFFLIYEDFDLAMRARLSGYRCVFVPEALVYHKYRSTLANFKDWQVFYSQRNVEYVYLKNMPIGLVFQGGLAHLLYNLGGLLYFGRKGFLLPFLSAKFQVVRELPRLCRKRKAIQAGRTVSPAEFRRLLKGKWLARRVRKWLGLATIPEPQRQRF